MKRILYTLFTVFLFLITGCSWFDSSDNLADTQTDESFNKLNILEYYKKLPSNLFLYEGFDEVKYNLKQVDDKWVTASIDEYKIEPVVDIKNGYIEILDEGTGGGSIHEIITLFRKADGAPVIGISLGGFDGLYQSSKTSFYGNESGSWKSVTNVVMPEISFSDFLDEEYVKQSLNTQGKAYQILRLVVLLPQFGNDVVVLINESQLHFLAEYAVDLDAMENMSEQDIAELFEIIGKIRYRSMKLTWDREEGRFHKGEKELINDQFIKEIVEGVE